MKYLVGLLAVISIFAITHAQGPDSQKNEMPAYHPAPPAKGAVLPPVWTKKQLENAGYTDPAQTAAYQAAAMIDGVLYQLPCFSYCDRNHGHQSLRSCFEGDYAAHCGICKKESLYAYKMSKKGWTPTMIRNGIVRGDYKTIDLEHPDPVN